MENGRYNGRKFVKVKFISMLVILLLVAGIVSACSGEPVDVPPAPLPTVTEVESRETAREFVTGSPTYLFDGIGETLVLKETLTARCPSCWTFVYEFDSLHAGYGDRTDRVLAQAITPHQVVITLQEGTVMQAIMDEAWDVQVCMMISSIEESVQIAEDFLRNSPTFQFDGIEGSITLVETLETFGFYSWGFTFEFECASAGYGDRTGRVLAQVITPHTVTVSVSQGIVDGGTIDGTWNMLAQQEITTPAITTATAP